MSEYVRISKVAATWLLQQSRNLVSAGLGTNWDPTATELPELQPGGLIDLVNMEEHELFDWSNAMLDLIRTLGGILARLIVEQDDGENVPPIRMLDFGPEEID